ncbi:hypothetical protein PIN31009_05547 [Pandoraea iniqua]|uniref:hypothetical protein n=1 Tax=Pandoraea iniqua TaxID=2508288 RepID=UPI001254D3CC|nr:hypothetical protein [Pandoraea iniqua]VVE59468.1 hypothetical protein PIN31009_05547 [Pandoraea iniqua]
MKGFHEATMMFRVGSEQRLHGVDVDTIIVEAVEVPDMLAEGWHPSPTAAREAEAKRLRETEERREREAKEAAERQACEEAERAATVAKATEGAAKEAVSTDKPAKAGKADAKAGSGA